jgi:molybdopterin-guanine dinucleotide biosynthesis protein A
MGQDKALLKRGDESQLDYLVGVLDACVERVFVSTRAVQSGEAVRSQYDLILDKYDNLGPVAGILSALETHREVDWLVVACDLPNINAATIHHLLEQRRDSHPFTAYSSSHDGLPEPLCAIYAHDSIDIVQEFLADGIKCPRKILIRSATQLLEQLDPTSLENVNTPHDLDTSVLRVAT